MALCKHEDGTYSVDVSKNNSHKNTPIYEKVEKITPNVWLAKFVNVEKWVLIDPEGIITQPIIFEGKPCISEINGETFKWKGVITKFDFDILPK